MHDLAKVADLDVGGPVVFVNERGTAQAGIVTAIWGKVDLSTNPPCIPCINLVVASLDDSKQYCYGRQTEHKTSVVYKINQPAHGMYYMLPGDEPNPVASVQV